MKNIVNLISTHLRDKAITQGETYYLTFSEAGDYSTATPSGQIRSGLAQDNGEILAEFSFTVAYDTLLDKTNFTAKLTASQTEIIPYTKFQGEGEANSSNCHLYDIELELANGDVVKPIALSFVQVKPEISVTV